MSTASKQRILVVDDDPCVRTMLKRALRGEGYGVVCAADSKEALRCAHDTAPDLVLLGVPLSEKDDWEVFERLIQIKPLLPVVIVTSKANQLFTALSAGAGALLEKPFHFPKLLRAVRQLLAESVEMRLARMTGRIADFHYLPAWHGT